MLPYFVNDVRNIYTLLCIWSCKARNVMATVECTAVGGSDSFTLGLVLTQVGTKVGAWPGFWCKHTLNPQLPPTLGLFTCLEGYQTGFFVSKLPKNNWTTFGKSYPSAPDPDLHHDKEKQSEASSARQTWLRWHWPAPWPLPKGQKQRCPKQAVAVHPHSSQGTALSI